MWPWKIAYCHIHFISIRIKISTGYNVLVFTMYRRVEIIREVIGPCPETRFQTVCFATGFKLNVLEGRGRPVLE